MSFANEKLLMVFDKILNEMEKNGGQMTTNEFKHFLYSLRFTKEDVKDIKRWLNLNGYVIINHGYQKETLILNNEL